MRLETLYELAESIDAENDKIEPDDYDDADIYCDGTIGINANFRRKLTC